MAKWLQLVKRLPHRTRAGAAVVDQSGREQGQFWQRPSADLQLAEAQAKPMQATSSLLVCQAYPGSPMLGHMCSYAA